MNDKSWGGSYAGLRTSAFLLLAVFLMPSTALALVDANDGIPPEVILSKSSLGTRDSAGAFTYDIPITVPPGRNGLQPDLKLTYNNRDSEGNNLFGYGWSINIPYIQRLNKRGVENLYNNYYFLSTLDGELATTTATTSSFAPLVENGSFNSYTFSNNVWTVYDKKGTRFSFGTTTASRQDNAASSTQIYTWYLDEVRDTNDNYIKYEYDKDNGQVYPSRITYTGNGSADGIYKVEFTRVARADTATSSAPGFTVISKYIISAVTARTNDQVTRQYALSYSTGDNGVRLRLASSTESGVTETGATTTLPALNFFYQGPTKSWTQDTNYSIPLWFSRDKYDQGVRFGDVNGDGLLDLIKSSWKESEGTIQQVYIHKGDGTGWSLDSNYSIPMTFTYNEVDRGVFLDDINGDGFVDLMQSYTDSNGANSESVYLNKKDGTGWNLISTSSVPVLFLNNRTYQGVRTADVNGDGLTDLVQSYNNNQGTTAYGVYTGNGDGTWTQNSTYSIPIDFQLGPGDVGTRLVDINNDGLTDILQSYQNCSSENSQGTYLNKGDSTGWTLVSTSTIPEPFTVCNQDKGVRVADINGDGLLDFIKAFNDSWGQSSQAAYINKGNGTGWTQDNSYTAPEYLTYNGTEYGTRFVDIDGDGLPDTIRSYNLPGGTSVQKHYSHNGVKSDFLKRIDLPEGGSITVTYTNSNKYLDAITGKPLNKRLPLTLTTASAIARSDGLGNVSTTTYSYGGGLYYFSTTLDRKFAGFATTTITDAAGDVTKEFRHQGDNSLSSIGEYGDHISKAGKVYRVEQYDGSNNLFKKIINRWDRLSQATNRDFAQLIRTVEYLYDGDSDHKDKAEEFTYATSTGNLTQKTSWGEVVGSDDGTFSDTGTDKFVQDFTYASTTNRNLVGLIASETLNDQSGVKVFEKRHYYDSLSLGNISIGNETKTEFWKSSSNYASTTKAYNSYGLVTQERDPLYKLTTYVYEAFNLYPATTTNPLSQIIQKTYDYSSGKVKVTTDQNNRQFETMYDGFDRPLEEKQPDLTSPSSLVTKKSYAYTDSSGAKSVLETSYLDGSTNFTVYTYFDGLNRKVQTRKEAESSNEFAVRDFTYNNLGLAYRDSLSYFSSGISRTTATSTSALYTTYLYDALKRINTVGTAVGTTTNAYDQWATTIIDVNGKSKDLTNDAYGNLAQVVERNGASSYTTTYTYNGLNKLTKITDASGNIRNFTYDGMGRRLTAEDLHAVGDGTYGTWTYTYDDAGSITSQVDPKSQTVNFTYDDINRPLTENYTGAAGTEMTYTYDSCTEGIGRLCSAAALNSATTTYAYNSTGGVATTTKTIAGSSFATGVVYNRQANPLTITHPNFAQTRYAYNTAGLLETVQFRDTSTTSVAILISKIDYAPTEQPTYRVFGNDTETVLTYDANKLYRLVNILTTATTTGAGGGGEAGAGGLALLKARAMFYVLKNMSPSLLIQEALETAIPIIDATSTTIVETTSTSTESVPLDTGTTTLAALEPVSIPAPMANEMPQEDIGSVLMGEKADERATIKGQEIVRLNPVGEYESAQEGIRIRITKVEAIEGGVQVFARAWKNGVQLGFGADGTTDMERFRIFNPPILVQDPLGEVAVKEITYLDGTRRTVRYRKDPLLALQQTLAHTMSLVGKNDTEIIPGSIGNTTDTFFSNASGDGSITTNNGTFANNRAGIGTFEGVNTTNASQNFYEDTNYAMRALFFPFETSAIPSGDTVSSATFSLYGDAAGQNSPARGVGVLQSAQASPTSLTTSDWVPASYTEIATRKNIANLSTGAYNDYTLSDLSVVAKGSGFTKLMILNGPIIDNDSVSGSWYFNFFMSDQSGTTNDPKLVVVHTASNVAPSAPTSLETEGQTNPINIADSTPEFSAIYVDANTSDVATSYQIQVATSSSFASTYWDSSKTSLASSTPQGTCIAPISYAGSTLASSTAYYWRIRLWDTADAQGAWSTGTSTFSLNGIPTSPTSLLTESQTDPTGVTDPTPEFSAIYNDPDTSDVAIDYQIQVATSTAFTYNVWDSNRTALSSTTPQGSRNPDISYAGSALASSTTYYWRIKFWDTASSTGEWSTATSSFRIAGGGGIQNLTFTYDAVGNITEISDSSDTNTNKVVAYTYDDLYRLTVASTTAATSTPYRRTYTYDALGNITTASDLGTYEYSGSGYLNPHGVSAIGSGVSTTTYAYDNNGNLTSAGSATYTWDYRNRLATASPVTSSYGYDHTNQRVLATENGSTTIYPERTYTLQGATTTLYVYAGDALITTIEGNGTATTSSYTYADQLGSTQITANSSGTIKQTFDYYPYGAKRLNQGSGTEKRQYIGQYYDTATALSYLNARYYDGSRGQFLSQDPSFLDIGAAGFEQNYERTLPQHLANPQALNSYSYGLNNPLTNKDPGGEIVPLVLAAYAAFEIGLSVYDAYSTAATLANPNAGSGEKAFSVGGFFAGLALPGGGYGAVSKQALQIFKQTNSVGQSLMKGVNNADVLRAIKDNYKAGSTVGKSGSTADAVRHEILTGERVGGRFHSTKAQEQINRINNLFKNSGADLNSQEKKVLNSISNDLKNALKTKK